MRTLKKVVGCVLSISLLATSAVTGLAKTVERKTAIYENALISVTQNAKEIIDLDSAGMETGKKYELSWNVKPETNSGWEIIHTGIDDSSFDMGESGDEFGIASLFDEYIMNMSGDMFDVTADMKAKILTEGINVSVKWDTEANRATFTVGNSAKTYSYIWKTGKMPENGKFGKLFFTSQECNLTVSNFVISLVVEEPEFEDYKIEYNFDDFDITSDSAWVVPASGGCTTIDEGALKIVSDSDNEYNVKYQLPTSLDGGIYRMTFKFKFEQQAWNKKRNSIRLYNSSGNNKLILGIENNYIMKPSQFDWYGWAGTDAGLWHTYDVTLDLENDKFSVNFGCPWKNWTSAVDAGELKLGGNISYLEFMSNAAVKSLWIDDFKIEAVKDEPVVDKAKISFVDGAGNIQENWKELAPATTNIKIDFGTNMYKEQLNDNYIYITDEPGNKLSYSGSFADNVYTMTLDKLLIKGETYKLFVSGSIKNSVGVSSGKDYEVSFIAGDGGVTQTAAGIKSGNDSVTSLAELLAKTSADAVLDYTNTTGIAKKLYMAVNFYKDGEMVKSNYFEINRDAAVYKEEIKQSFNIPQIDGIDNVKVMVWDGFDSMKSVADFITLQ